MGITGLLPFLEKASKRVHVSEFKGSTVAIDAYCWLHRGAFGCAERLARGEDVNGYVLYCMKYIKMLQLYKIRPIMVFDGQHLPAKKLTEEKRRKQRQSSKQKAAEMLRLGNGSEARKFLLQSIDITHDMALALIKECRKDGVDCIVAPYEADAQLAYLNISKLADFVITEDSDLLLFGCKKIFFKMDVHGHGMVVEADKINDCMKLRSDKFSFDKFRYMCILSGCDYVGSLPGVGLKKALKFISVTENPNIYNALPQVPTYLKLSNAIVTDEYRNNFMLADATFRHQLVFDPKKRCLLPLNPITPDTNIEHCKNAGNMSDNRLAFQLALGNIDPFTHKKVDDWNPDSSPLCTLSIWSKNLYQPKESTMQDLKRPLSDVKDKVTVIDTSSEDTVSYNLEINSLLDMYRKMGPVEKPVVSETKDLYTLLHGDNDTSKNGPSNSSRKFAPTVIDYEQGVRSRFFKPKDDKPKDEDNEPMVSLLGAIDNLIKKRKTTENNDIEKSPEIMTKRRKSDTENEVIISENRVITRNLSKKFQFRKEKIQSLEKNIDLDIKEVQNNESNDPVYIEIEEVLGNQDIAETSNISSPIGSHITSKHLMKTQTTILRFFAKQ